VKIPMLINQLTNPTSLWVVRMLGLKINSGSVRGLV
jgi:hypothetical protein